jgi:hypothetical protein
MSIYREACYLSEEAQEYVRAFVMAGVDHDLAVALVIAGLTEAKLWDLESGYESREN